MPPLLRRALERAAPWMLATWFTVASLQKLIYFLLHGIVGVDFYVYRAAGAAALAGGDPWATAQMGNQFAAPPPTVLPYMLLAVIPEQVALLISVVTLAGAAVAVVRALHLPWWWLLFPPIVDSLLAQNPDVLVIALLVTGRDRAALAPIFKIYAVIPLVLQMRWRPLIGAGLIFLLCLPLLPAYLGHAGELSSVLAQQSGGGLSVWGTLMVVPVIVSLVLLGREAASWLVVPTLWPSTQLHYNCLAIPEARKSAFLAAGFAVGVPGLSAWTVVAWAAWTRWKRLRALRARPYEDPAGGVAVSEGPAR